MKRIREGFCLFLTTNMGSSPLDARIFASSSPIPLDATVMSAVAMVMLLLGW
jgi:hypothetical protein